MYSRKKATDLIERDKATPCNSPVRQLKKHIEFKLFDEDFNVKSVRVHPASPLSVIKEEKREAVFIDILPSPRSYSQYFLLKKIEIYCKDKKPGNALDLNEAQIYPDHLAEAILYREHQQTIEYEGDHEKKPKGYCFGLIILLWLSGKNTQEFFSLVRLMITCPPEYWNDNSDIKTFLAKMEYIQWSYYHANINQTDVAELLNNSFKLSVASGWKSYKKFFTVDKFVYRVKTLQEGELLIISSAPRPEYENKKHAVGITRREDKFYYYDANGNNQEKIFDINSLNKLFEEDLIESLYYLVNVPAPLKIENVIFGLYLDINILQHQVERIQLPVAPPEVPRFVFMPTSYDSKAITLPIPELQVHDDSEDLPSKSCWGCGLFGKKKTSGKPQQINMTPTKKIL